MKVTRKLFLLTITLTALLLTACGKDTPASVETATSVPVTEVSVEVSVPEPVHEHDMVTVSNGDGTHTTKCADSDGLACDLEETVDACTFDESYICTVCGYEHVHELALIENTELDKQHMYECTVDGCDYTEVVDCTLDEDTWICTECGINWVYKVEPIESAVKYATVNLNVRSIPNKSGELMKELKVNDEVTVTGKVNEFKGEACDFYQLDDGNFADGRYLSDEKVTVKETPAGISYAPNGNVLDYSKPNVNVPGNPYSEDGYVLSVVIDNGDEVCIYHPSFDTGHHYPSGGFGQLQKQADDLWYSKGHSSHAWHMVKLPNGVFKWYLTD